MRNVSISVSKWFLKICLKTNIISKKLFTVYTDLGGFSNYAQSFMEYSFIDDSLGSFSEVFEKKNEWVQDQENPVKLQECSVNDKSFISEEFKSPLKLDECSVNDRNFILEEFKAHFNWMKFSKW